MKYVYNIIRYIITLDSYSAQILLAILIIVANIAIVKNYKNNELKYNTSTVFTTTITGCITIVCIDDECVQPYDTPTPVIVDLLSSNSISSHSKILKITKIADQKCEE